MLRVPPSFQGTTLSQFRKKGDSEPKRSMTVGSGWSVTRAAKAGDGFVVTAPGRVTKLRAPSEQEELEVRGRGEKISAVIINHSFNLHHSTSDPFGYSHAQEWK